MKLMLQDWCLLIAVCLCVIFWTKAVLDRCYKRRKAHVPYDYPSLFNQKKKKLERIMADVASQLELPDDDWWYNTNAMHFRRTAEYHPKRVYVAFRIQWKPCRWNGGRWWRLCLEPFCPVPRGHPHYFNRDDVSSSYQVFSIPELRHLFSTEEYMRYKDLELPVISETTFIVQV